MPAATFCVSLHKEVDLNDTTPYAFSLVYKADASAGNPKLHSHRTGLVGLQVSGSHFGVELSDRHFVVPRHTVFWIPPDIDHCTTQSQDTVSIALHIAPEVAQAYLPTVPVRMIINPMTEEMIKHFARIWQTTENDITAKRIAKLIVSELAHAPHLQKGFAPLPDNPVLRAVAECILSGNCGGKTMQQWAEQFEISTKTLARLTLKHTGLTFSQWSLQFRLFPALSALSEGKTVEATAGQCGYETTAAFIAAFTRVFGTTPGKYRRVETLSDFPENIYPTQNH